ncbi:transglutaminase domain-containing protein [Ascidiimonas sp. W6]|uniref:transglutaminase domain-containing protein n=1 Tax=Ascidiimonas meishanensis TaxID=3128903 RepID=UPI0030EF199F
MKIRLPILFFLIFIASVSSQNTSIKRLVDKTKTLNLDIWDLTDFAQENLKTDAELARFFYYWIGNNIKYDYEFLGRMGSRRNIYYEYVQKQSAYRVYEDKKAVCAGYAYLFSWFMREVNIEEVYITGHIRNEQNPFIEMRSDKNFRHAWNAIRINGKWILVDTTWGTSYDTSQSEFYFDIKPEIAINTYYPMNSKWQLLKNPLSLEEFNKSKFVKLIWYISGFSDIPKFKKLNNNYYLVYRTNLKNKSLSVRLEASENNSYFRPIQSKAKIDLNGFTYIKYEKEQIPENAYYKVNLYDSNYLIHKNVISFKTF